MPQNITDTETYHATIQTVADGDAANAANFSLAPQGLADRTAYLKGQVDAIGGTVSTLSNTTNERLTALERYAQYRVSGASVAAGNKFTLALWTASGTFALSSNEVQVPAAGVYLVLIDATIILDSSADYAVGLYVGGVKATGRRITGPSSGTVYRTVALSHVASITTPASQKLDFRVVETTMSLHNDNGLGEHCNLTIQRLL